MKRTFDPDSEGGFGKYGIRERFRHLGGQLAIKSKPGKGTTVLILCPQDFETNTSEYFMLSVGNEYLLLRDGIIRIVGASDPKKS